MANVLAELFGGIADAIREKNGTTAAIKPTAFADAIRGIETGGGSSADVRYVTFRSHDGSVEYGTKPVAMGDDCADPLERGLFDPPVRQTDAQYSYTFVGWTATPGNGADENALSTVTENRVLYAVFSAAVRSYTITYYDGDTMLKTQSLAYGATPSYAPAKLGYTFTGWVPTPVPVTEDASYSAQWIEKMDFEALSWEQIAEYAQSGEASLTFDLGATKTFNLVGAGTPVTARIIGFQQDDLADGTGKAGITLMLEGFWNAYGALHGGANYMQKSTAWPNMEMRSALRARAAAQLPGELLAVMKTVIKKTYDPVNTAMLQSEDTVFLPSRDELDDLAGFMGYPDEGPFYPYYADNASRVITYNGVAVPWWTRTKANASNGTMRIVKADGSFSTADQANLTNGGYPFACVCI